MTATSGGVLDMSDVAFRWPGADSFALEIGRFEVAAGERVMLLGPSGSGKSTLLSLVCGILKPDRGRIAVLGQDLMGLSASARDTFRAEHIGVIFQMFNLLPYGSVQDNVALALSFAPQRARRVAEAGGVAQETERLLARLGLSPSGMTRRSAAQLSVGQQQRVAAARALIGTPELIIADEPTSALDSDRRTAFLDLLFSEVTAAGSALLMVSHDEGLAGRFDRVVRLAELLKAGGAGARTCSPEAAC